MAKTVDEGFRTFLGWLTPTGEDTERAKRHRASIEDCLKRNFGITRFFRIGSFGNGTSIHNYSDVDYLAEFPKRHVDADSAAFIRKVCRVLDARFPRTGVKVDSPAVLVPFGTDKSEWTEVVPADRMGETKLGYAMYDIADGSGGWLKSSPESHNKYVANTDSGLSGKLKPLIRFVKAWNFMQNVGISSFYLELFTTKYAASEKAIIYSMDVRYVLGRLKDGGLAPLQDPRGISGEVSACDGILARWSAQEKVAEAYEWACKARAAESADRTAEAFRWWDKVYAGSFPAYY